MELTNNQRDALIAWHRKRIHEWSHPDLFWSDPRDMLERIAKECRDIEQLQNEKEDANGTTP